VTELLASQTTHAQMERLLRPRSIALIGASSTPGSLGASVLANLDNAEYSGNLHLVNPKRAVIGGRTALGSIDELPDNIDCAVLAIPGAGVLEAVRACAKKGFGSTIIFSAGFAESGAQGEAAQREIAEIAKATGMIVEGPNCLGMVNYRDGIALTFVATPPQPRSDLAGAAILSQSGALAAVIAVNMRHHKIPLTHSVSTGNEAASGIEDYLEHLLSDDAARVFALVVEQFRSPQRFLRLARRARAAGKFLVLLHPGSSGAARASAATHTGALAGDYDVMHTLVRHAGVIHVETLEELVDVTQILVRSAELPCAGAAIFAESGAFKALALDLCERVALKLPALTRQSEQALRAALPPFIPPSNPLDITAQGLVDPTLYRRTLPAFLDDPSFGSVVLAIILTDAATTALKLPPIIDAIRSLRPQKPIIFAAMDEGGPFDSPAFDELRSLGVACFPSPERALRALSHVSALAARSGSSSSVASPASEPSSIEPGTLPEYKSKALLASLGIPIPQGRFARTLDEAHAATRDIGFPVALKAQSAALPHKTEAGAVILNIASEQSLSEAWSTLHRNIESHRAGLVLDGVLVEKMSPRGIELIVGARNDRDWGPVLLVGIGGVLAEALRDTRLLPADLSVEEIVNELHQLRGAKILRGFRGSPPADAEAAARIIAALGAFVRGNPPVAEIDVNPLVVYPTGKGAVALDAHVIGA
jgi:acyl-CoA synthetase (NDP forming)